jgi:hypothetical protein
VPLCQSLNFRLSYRREVCVFGSDDPPRHFGMMGPQIFFQELAGVAFSNGMTDEDDLTRRSDIFRDLFIKRILFGHTLATVVSFLSMNQMMMEMIRIVRSHLVFVRRMASTEILVDVGRVVVDDDNHSAGFGRFFYGRTRFIRNQSRFLQEFAQPRNFLDAKIVGVRLLEKDALAADAKHKFIVPVRLDLTKRFDQFDSLAPTQVMGKLAVEKILVQRFEVLTHGAFPFTTN